MSTNRRAFREIAVTVVEMRALRRKAPWRAISGIAAAFLCVATAALWFNDSYISDDVQAAILPAAPSGDDQAGTRRAQRLLEQELGRGKELEQQLAARQIDRAALARERAHSQELEQQLAALRSDRKALALELAKLRGALPDRDRTLIATASLPLPQSWAFDLVPTLQITLPASANRAPLAPTARQAVLTPAAAAPHTPPQAAGTPDAVRLLARAKLLLEQGDVGAARSVLERAVEAGSAPALFALAETYDPAVLSAWGTVGTQGDPGKARELYGQAFAHGVVAAKDRLNASR
jgi:hypothetical protein